MLISYIYIWVCVYVYSGGEKFPTRKEKLTFNCTRMNRNLEVIFMYYIDIIVRNSSLELVYDNIGIFLEYKTCHKNCSQIKKYY